MNEQEELKYAEWLQTRPKEIQELAKKYPPGEYVIKEGAPYVVSCSGTKVILVSYFENGQVTVIVTAENKLPQALEHEATLARRHDKKVAQLERINQSDISVEIDPKWLG